MANNNMIGQIYSLYSPPALFIPAISEMLPKMTEALIRYKAYHPHFKLATTVLLTVETT